MRSKLRELVDYRTRVPAVHRIIKQNDTDFVVHLDLLNCVGVCEGSPASISRRAELKGNNAAVSLIIINDEDLPR
ncbi:MAG: hypothetical protein WBE26_17675 [Phycisphaerae bacterium]